MTEVHREEREGGGAAHREPLQAPQRDGEGREHPHARERPRERADAGHEAREAEGRGQREQPLQRARLVAFVAHRPARDRHAEGHDARDRERHQRLARVTEHPHGEQRGPEQRAQRRGVLPEALRRTRSISLRCNEFA